GSGMASGRLDDDRRVVGEAEPIGGRSLVDADPKAGVIGVVVEEQVARLHGPEGRLPRDGLPLVADADGERIAGLEAAAQRGEVLGLTGKAAVPEGVDEQDAGAQG